MERNTGTGMKFLFFLVLFLLAIPSLALAAFPVRFEGTVTINGNSSSAAVNGAIVTAHINNNDTAVKTAVVGSHPTGTVTAGWYIAEVPCDSGNNITFRVWGVNASPTNATPENCTGLWKGVNLSMTKLLNGGACLYDGGCNSSHCSSDFDGSGKWCVASTSCVHDNTTYSNSGTVCANTSVLETCNSGFWNATTCANGCSAGACSAAAAAAAAGGGGAVTAKTASKKMELVPGKGIIDNTKLLDAITKVLGKDKLSEEAKQNLLTLSASITQNTEVNRDIKAETSKTTVTSKVKYKGEQAKNYMVYDKVPKTFAKSHANLTISAVGATIKVVEEDPEYVFTYPEVSKDQELTITYSVAKELNTSLLDEFGPPELYAESVAGAAAAVLVCTPNEKKCVGNDLQVCSADGSAWTTRETCTYGCEAGACKAAAPLGVFFGPGADYTWYIVGVVIVVVIVAVIFVRKRK